MQCVERGTTSVDAQKMAAPSSAPQFESCGLICVKQSSRAARAMHAGPARIVL